MVSNASCNKCTFFDDHKTAVQSPKADGLCRYNPPVTQAGPDEHGLWPVVSTSDWCGHFAPESAAPMVAAE